MTDTQNDLEMCNGSDLCAGDVVHTWRGREMISSLRPYTGPLDCFIGGAQIARFARGWEMTIENGGRYAVAKAEGR